MSWTSPMFGDVVVGGVVEGEDAGSGVVGAPKQAPLQGWRVVEVDVGDVGADVVAANVGAHGEDAMSGADEGEHLLERRGGPAGPDRLPAGGGVGGAVGTQGFRQGFG